MHSPIVVRAPKTGAEEFKCTEWFSPEVKPTIAGEYRARTGGGHVFPRKWNGQSWLNVVTGQPSTAPMDWCGVVPGSVSIDRYPASLRTEMLAGLNLMQQHEAIGLPVA